MQRLLTTIGCPFKELGLLALDVIGDLRDLAVEFILPVCWIVASGVGGAALARSAALSVGAGDAVADLVMIPAFMIAPVVAGHIVGIGCCLLVGALSDKPIIAARPHQGVDALSGKPIVATRPHHGAVIFSSCFISYSHGDEEFAQRLHADLQDNGVRCWFAPHDIEGGKKLHEQINAAIRAHDRLLLVLSEKSIASRWVEHEISRARNREVKDDRRVLFPIRLVDYAAIEEWECFDTDTKKDMAREIREYFIPDFSNWKDHDSYKAAFDRLLRDLKQESGAGSEEP